MSNKLPAEAQLPVEVEKRLNHLAKIATQAETKGRVPIYKIGYESGYASGLEAASYLLIEVLTKHESGLLPDRFIYEKIKKFLYGE